ncbi:MAG TPA: hydrolase TatD [Candidatus Portnoybacteria bacterium]|nr:hydrolase TatD [Candidatus Portnoybacteria bacterium]
MLIDTHAHVNFVAYKEDGDEVVKRTLAEDVWLINVGAQEDTSRRAVEYAQRYPAGVFAAVGLHPIHLRAEHTEAHIDEYETVEFSSRIEKFDYDEYKKLAQEPKVVAIGEVGLDYYRIKNNESGIMEKQKEVFKKQIELAIDLQLPLIIHCRNAHADILEILNSYFMIHNSKIKGVIHSFSGRWSQAQEYLEMGFYLGFNGIITFARDYDRVVREMPLTRLLLETDCPYLTPIPFRGKRNEPSYVKYVAQRVAELRNITFEEVAEVTTRNARELFKI